MLPASFFVFPDWSALVKKFVVNPPVFTGSVAIACVFLTIGVVFPNRAEAFFNTLQQHILNSFGWLYLLTVGGVLATVLLLCLGRFGCIRLGPDDSTPDFSFISWLAMLFAAGMGIGLMFFAVGEPMSHYIAPPTAEPRTVEATREAMAATFFHWGIHAWAVYAIVGLSLAYFGYRYNLPLTIRSGLYPLLKERINGPIGYAVDIFAIVGTLFGIATSMGLGVTQINGGLNYLLGVPIGPEIQLPLIAGVTLLAAVSVATGLDKGIRLLSESNLVVAILLMIFVLIVGPTAQLMRDFVQNVGLYLDSLLLRTFNIYAYEPTPWIDAWTLFYWAWWISWSPFVGMFIARISRGRTVREFVGAVLFIPAGFTFFWMTVFGNTAIFIDNGVAAGELGRVIANDVSVGLFQFFQYLPWPGLTSTLAVLLVTIFFVTSSDSGSLVVDSIAAGGETETTTAQRIFWCVLEGGIAASLLLAGGLGALQSATIISALPFTFVLIALVWSLIVGMRSDLSQRNLPTRAYAAAGQTAGRNWQRRLSSILHTPTQKEVERFIKQDVRIALDKVAHELNARGRETNVADEAEGVALRSPAEDVRDFVYGVSLTPKRLASISPLRTKPEYSFEARTYFSSGERGYDIMGMLQDEVISDVLAQFERYLNLVGSADAQLVHAAPEHDQP